MLSIVNSCRIDNYEGDCVGRYVKSVTDNCKNLEEVGLEYEYITTEYCPIDKYLYYHEATKDLFDKYNCKDVILDSSVAIAEGLNPKSYYEYFCKNLGIRQSKHKNILLTNADIILTKPLIQEIKNLIDIGINRAHFYRTVWRTQISPEDGRILHTDSLVNPEWSDSCIAGCYSGDFLLAHRDVLIDDAQGYDETNPSKRKGFQSNMDGEILWKLHKLGITMKPMKHGYNHIWHSKDRVYDSGAYDQSGTYKNKPNWGFVDYKCIEEVPDKLYIITA